MSAIVLVILTILTNALSGYVYTDNPDTWKCYFVGQALSYVFAFWSMHDILGYIKNEKLKYCKIIVEIGILLSFSNLLDEMFFDPVHLGINEIFFAIIIIIRAGYKCRTLKQK